MAKKYAFEAEVREGTGKGVARALRREHKVPAVIYGDKKEPVNITLPAKEVNLEYNKGHMFNTLCDVTVGNDKHVVLARDVQLHPVKDFVEHVDFLRVTSKTKIVVGVHVNFINEEECIGLKEGGILNTVRYEVELACSATNIPDNVEIDLTNFDVGDAIKLSDAKLPEGATSAVDRDITIATIAAPRALVEETDEEAEGEEGAETAEGEEGEGSAEGEEGAEKAEGGDE
jgi:large subunit ribosomal protein L25